MLPAMQAIDAVCDSLRTWRPLAERELLPSGRSVEAFLFQELPGMNGFTKTILTGVFVAPKGTRDPAARLQAALQR